MPDSYAGDLVDLPVTVIRRPLGRTRSNGKHALLYCKQAVLWAYSCWQAQQVQAHWQFHECGLPYGFSVDVQIKKRFKL